MGIPDHLTCLLRNVYAGQGATVRTGHGKTDWSQIGKGVYQGCILSPCLFNLYAEYIRRNAGLEEAQAGINIAGRNINNLRCAEDIMFIKSSCWGRIGGGPHTSPSASSIFFFNFVFLVLSFAFCSPNLQKLGGTEPGLQSRDIGNPTS